MRITGKSFTMGLCRKKARKVAMELNDKAIDPMDPRKLRPFRAGLACPPDGLIQCFLLLNILSNNRNRSAATAAGKIAGRP